jgi:hypothetical protein
LSLGKKELDAGTRKKRAHWEIAERRNWRIVKNYAGDFFTLLPINQR